MLHIMMIDFARDRRAFAPDGDGNPAPAAPAAPAAGDPSPAAAAAPAAPAAGAQKWWEGERFADPARQYLTAKGLTVDDPMEAMPKLVDIASNAEKRIGKGLDSILDKPAKDQPYADWVAKNRDALNLPKDEAAYQIAPPENWPKDAPWDTAREGKARAIAVKHGIPNEALQELVALQADGALETYTTANAIGEEAKRQLMTDLERDFGTQTPAVIQRAKQGAQAVAERAGIDMAALGNLSEVLTDKIGDANTIRFMNAIGEMLGDDAALGLGKGGGLTTTPADARAELAKQRAPGGEYYEATAKGDRAAMERLKPKIDNLTRIAAKG